VARLYEGDSPLYPSSAVLKGGEELRILEERDGWYRVKTTAGGREGWCEGFSLLRADDVVKSY
jgi:SH3-like domain-containing protein